MGLEYQVTPALNMAIFGIYSLDSWGVSYVHLFGSLSKVCQRTLRGFAQNTKTVPSRKLSRNDNGHITIYGKLRTCIYFLLNIVICSIAMFLFRECN